jgi:hypothetical protein
MRKILEDLLFAALLLSLVFGISKLAYGDDAGMGFDVVKGQTTMTESLPVAIASDQTALQCKNQDGSGNLITSGAPGGDDVQLSSVRGLDSRSAIYLYDGTGLDSWRGTSNDRSRK